MINNPHSTVPPRLILQSKAPLTTNRIIPPPIRHTNHLPTPKKQKDQQHIKVKPRIKRCSQYIIIPGPQLISISVRPIHDDERADKLGEIARGDVAVEVGEPAEEDGAVPEVELRFGEAPREQVEEGGGDSAHEEAVGERLVDLDAEEFFGALGHGGLD